MRNLPGVGDRVLPYAFRFEIFLRGDILRTRILNAAFLVSPRFPSMVCLKIHAVDGADQHQLLHFVKRSFWLIN